MWRPQTEGLQDSLLVLSAAAAGVAAEHGEADKVYHYEAVVKAAGGIFVPLVLQVSNVYFNIQNICTVLEQ